MSTNGATESKNDKDSKKGQRKKGRSLAELTTTGLAPAVLLEDGSYPALFLKWSEESFVLTSAKFGDSEKMEGYFAVRNTAPEASSVVRIVRMMVNVPASMELHPKSGLYKVVRPLANGDDKLWDGKRDNIKKGVTLEDFALRTCLVEIKSKDGFANIIAVSAPPRGVEMPFPSYEEAQEAMARREQHEDEGDDSLGGEPVA